MDPINPTEADIIEARKRGLPVSRIAEQSEVYKNLIAKEELEALRQRVETAKAAGQPISINDELAWRHALDMGWVLPAEEQDAHSLIQEGLQQAELDRQAALAIKMNALGETARECEAAIRTPAWHDFGAKVLAVRQAQALRAQFNAAAKEAEKDAGGLINREYRELVFGHIEELRLHLNSRFGNEG